MMRLSKKASIGDAAILEHFRVNASFSVSVIPSRHRGALGPVLLRAKCVKCLMAWSWASVRSVN